MKAGMRRIVSLVKGYAVLSCGHLIGKGRHDHWHVGSGYAFCPTCPRKGRA